MSTMTELVARTRSKLTAAGLGEKPTIIQGAADASETVSGATIAFDVATDEGAKIEAGDVLSVLGAATADDAFVLYVLSKSTDTITALHTYNGSPAATTADDLDGAIFELGAEKPELHLWRANSTVISTLLYPEVYKYSTYSVTPDLTDYQVDLNAAVEKIEFAYQVWGGERCLIPYDLQKNVHTSVSATGVMGTLYAIDGSSVFVTARERYLESDTLSDALMECVATGAAALVSGASRAATNQESVKKDSQFRGQRNPADSLWRDFVTLRSAIAEDVASEVDWFEYARG